MFDQKLTGKVSIITGSGRGIGAATAKLFASHGAKVVLVSRSQDEINSVGDEIEKFSQQEKWPIYYRPLVIKADVSDSSSVDDLFEKTKKKWGFVDCLVNNAAVIKISPFSELSLRDWKQTIDVNLTGMFLCSKSAFKHMQESKKGGSIVNISSLAGLRGTTKFPGFSAYSTTKFGVVGMSECMAVEGKPFGIRVNCIAPGAVDTKMLHDAAPLLKTTTKPCDIAKSIFFFCDETQSSKVSGSLLEIFTNE